MSFAVNSSVINVNVLAPPPQNANTSLSQNIYEYYRNPENSLLLKICVASLTAFATLALGYLLGNMLLITATVSSLWVCGASMESMRLEHEATIQEERRHIARLEMINVLGGYRFTNATFGALDLGMRESATGAIDFLRLSEVQTRKQGVDKYGRYFYAIPIVRIDNYRSWHLLVLYEKYITGDVWEMCGPPDLMQNPLSREGKEAIGDILAWNHPRYRATSPMLSGD